MTQILLQLFILAIWKSYDLNINNYWSHDNSNGQTFSQRVEVFKRDIGVTNSEILYKGECNLKTATDTWNDSPTHADIMNNTDNKYGVCMIVPKTDDGLGGCYITCEYVRK